MRPEEIEWFLDRLAKVLGSEETIWQLPQLPDIPDLMLYKTLLGQPTAVHVFRLVVARLPEQLVVVVVDCFHRRERAI